MRKIITSLLSMSAVALAMSGFSVQAQAQGSDDDEIEETQVCRDDPEYVHIPFTYENHRGELIVETTNPGSLRAHTQDMAQRRAHVVGMQEHIAPKAEHEGLNGSFKMLGRQLHLGKPDPEKGRPAAGVGRMAKNGVQILSISPHTKEAQDAMDLGRQDVKRRKLLLR